MEVDDRLTNLEGPAHLLIRQIIESEKAPRRYSPQAQMLMFYTFIQYRRTVEAAEHDNEMLDKMGKHVLTRSLQDPELISYLPQVTISLTDPFRELLNTAIMAAPLAYDLKIKILRNRTDMPFVTSDNPVVFHNTLYQDSGHVVNGLANEGLQIIFPLSPALTVMFYDAGCYNAGSIAKTVIDVSSDRYISELNMMQWLNAYQNVLFSPDVDPAIIHADAERYVSLRQKERMDLKIVPQVVEGRRRSELISWRPRPSPARMTLPTVRQLKRPRPLAEIGSLPLRNQAWCQHVRMASDALKANAITIDDFVKMTERP